MSDVELPTYVRLSKLAEARGCCRATLVKRLLEVGIYPMGRGRGALLHLEDVHRLDEMERARCRTTSIPPDPVVDAMVARTASMSSSGRSPASALKSLRTRRIAAALRNGLNSSSSASVVALSRRKT
jgi:hypothetical protein